MPIHYDIETDSLYLKGFKIGFEKGLEIERQNNVINMWQKRVEVHLISNLLALSIEQVEHILFEFRKNKYA